MVYSNKFVMCVLVKGRPQKDKKNGVVQLPFGTEYSLRLRNKHSRRALVKIFIDGENVSGEGYVIDANDYVDIKRHHDKDRAFKFVPLDSEEAYDFGKDGDNEDKEKGLIEARFYLEKERKPVPQPRPPWKPRRRTRSRTVIHKEEHHHHHHYDQWPKLNNPYQPPQPDVWVSCDNNENKTTGYKPARDMAGDWSDPINYSTTTGDHPEMKSYKAKCDYNPSCDMDGSWSKPTDEQVLYESEDLQDGCTVEGDSTGQSFTSVWFDSETTYTTIKLFLQGHGEYESEYEEEKPKKAKKKKMAKSQQIDDLEEENERLRKELAELENQRLKEQIEELQKDKAK